jgi:hypothetical protein
MSADSLSTWLALREPADTAARSAVLTQAIVAVLAHARPLRVLDLGSGTGSNLLAELSAHSANGPIDRVCLNLGSLDDPALFSGRHLVTGSALLDLVSDRWLSALAERCRSSGAAALFPLNYDGRSQCTPAEPEDELIRHLMNQHQRASDKGFGPAAGPDAIDCAERRFAAVGYQVRRETSDWLLLPEQRELQRQLIEGWAQAAEEIAPEQSAMIHDWLARRLAHVETGRSQVVVGHEDVAAWLP